MGFEGTAKATKQFAAKYVPVRNEGTEKKRFSISTPREYQVGEEMKTYWTTIGTAWQSEKGFNIVLDALPVNGKMFINTALTKEN